MLWSPKVLTITESSPASVSVFHFKVMNEDQSVQLASGNIPIAGTVTEFPIGSNGTFDTLTPGQQLRILVSEVGMNGDALPYQEVPGAPFTLSPLADGIEDLSVTL